MVAIGWPYPLIATTCVRAGSSGYREHQLRSMQGVSPNSAARASPSVRVCCYFFRAQGIAVAKRHSSAAVPQGDADNGQQSRTVTMQRTGGQRCVHASEAFARYCSQCPGLASGQRACHDQFLGCMGKFRCAVTMVGDAFQEQCGQSRERLRLSGPRLATAGARQLHCVTLTANARSSAELRQSMCVRITSAPNT